LIDCGIDVAERSTDVAFAQNTLQRSYGTALHL
jgi:hypothetical protein